MENTANGLSEADPFFLPGGGSPMPVKTGSLGPQRKPNNDAGAADELEDAF